MNLGALKLINLFFLIFFIFFSFGIKADPVIGNIVEIQILDKITAKVKKVEINVNDNLTFETLNIEIYSCYTNPPEEIPEDFVLLRIYDNMNLDSDKLIYQGWMISSSPSTTPLEHPIYDLWLNKCKVEIDF